jgi:hypothetical protein
MEVITGIFELAAVITLMQSFFIYVGHGVKG